jgi:ribose transport system substrate-binding protein
VRKIASRRVGVALVGLVTVFGAAACSSSPGGASGPAATPAGGGGAMSAADCVPPEGTPVSAAGPNGEEVTFADQISLTDEDVAAVKEGGYTAAMVWHENTDDLARALTQGAQEEFDRLGIDVVAVTDGQFNAAKQMNDIETVLALNPDAILSLPIDPVATANAYRTAVDRGVILSLVANVPEGFKLGTDYVGAGAADEAQQGVLAACILGTSLNGKGNVAMIPFDANFWATNQRDDAFRATIEEKFPDIKIVVESGFTDPAKTQEIAAALIGQQQLDGIYVSYAQAAEGVLSAIRAAGQDNIKLSTVDLSTVMALDMASGGPTVGLVSSNSIEVGKRAADVTALGLLGKPGPAYYVVPSVWADKENILDVWKKNFGADAPQEIQDAVAAQ